MANRRVKAALTRTPIMEILSVRVASPLLVLPELLPASPPLLLMLPLGAPLAALGSLGSTYCTPPTTRESGQL